MWVISTDEARLLATITDAFLCDQESSYEKYMDEILQEHPEPKDAIVNFINGFHLSSVEKVGRSVDLFLDLPFKEMPLYIIPKPYGQLKAATSACPPPEEGTLPLADFTGQMASKDTKIIKEY